MSQDLSKNNPYTIYGTEVKIEIIIHFLKIKIRIIKFSVVLKIYK